MKINKFVKLCFTSALLYAAQLQAQFTLSGQVKNQQGKGIPFAVVAIKNTQFSTVGDQNGNYQFKSLKPGRYEIITKILGYLEHTENIQLESNTVFDPILNASNKELDEVLVSATRVNNNNGMAFSNVDAETLKKQNLGQDAPLLLNQLPSVVVNSDAGNGVGYTGIRIRGSDGTRINVTINGVPVNDAESQGTFFVNMPDLVSSVNNIQVQRGVGTSNNGAGAFGASINFQTNTLNDKAFANVISTAGSFNTFRNTVSAGTGLIDNKFVINVRASKITSDGYIDRAASDLQSYYLAAAYYGKKTVLNFINFSGKEKTYQAWNFVNEDSIKAGNRTHNELGQYKDANGQIRYYDNQTDNYKQDNYQLHLIHQMNSQISLNFTGHYTKGKGYYEEYKAASDFASYNLSAPTLFINDSTPVSSTNLVRRKWLNNDFAGGIFNINYTAGSKLNFTLGGAYSTYFGKHYGNVVWAQYIKAEEMGKQYYYNTANKNDANIYIKTNYKPMQRLNVFVDLQLRHVDYRFLGPNNLGENKTQNQRFLFFNPKLGLSYNLNEHFNLYGSGAIANKEPNRNDFVENKPQNRPKSEQLFDIEAGAKYTSSKITAAVYLYNMSYKNQLVLNGQVNDVGAAKRVNVDKSFRRGLEFEYNQNLNRYFSFGGNLTLSQNKILSFNEYVDSSNVDYTISVSKKITHTNSDIALSPDIISALILTIKPFKNFEIIITNKYVGRQYLDNTKNTRRSIDPYQVVDLLLNYKINTKLFQEINLMCGIYNLLSKQYETNGYTYSYYYDSATLSTVNYKAPSAPINFLAGLNLKF